jgi:fumarylacetoacetase
MRRLAVSTIDHTHDPSASSWVESAATHEDFPVQNLPLGVFSPRGGSPRIGAAIGDQILDLAAASEAGHLPEDVATALQSGTLNALFALPPAARLALRRALFAILTSRIWLPRLQGLLHAATDCEMHLPFAIGDYTDFYVGINHATNIGKQFRPDNPLLPNYKHIPIGYHGRASSVRVSGTPVIRPKGQLKAPDAAGPAFAPCRRLDYELELGVWISGANDLGEPTPISGAPDRIGGYCLLNDWSARDIQGWEYQPLGPFLAKNFLSTVSPWVVTSDALAPFAAAQRPRPESDPSPLPYLVDARDQASGALALTLEVQISTAAMRAAGQPAERLGLVGADMMYWTPAQMVAHHTSNGCYLAPGDLLGTGTISGADRQSLGSMMELSEGGRAPVPLPSGETRSFLEDGDVIIMRAKAEKVGYRTIGFGPCQGEVVGSRA